MVELFGIGIGAIVGFVVGLLAFAKIIYRRVSKQEMEAICLQAMIVKEKYDTAMSEESEGGKEITRDEWIAISIEAAALAEMILKAIEK